MSIRWKPAIASCGVFTIGSPRRLKDVFSKTGVPGIGGVAVKLLYSELDQQLGDLAMRVLGRAGLSRDDVGTLPSKRFLASALKSLSLTIAAGTSQIQRNIIAERILGLPRERQGEKG